MKLKMRYIKIIGGLGNQLFQYSFAYYIYKKTKEQNSIFQSIIITLFISFY